MKLQRKQLTDEMQKAFKEVTGDFLNKRVCEILIDVFATAITNVLVSGNDVNIRGFGTFQPRRRAPKIGYNPSTGQPQAIAANTTVLFKPSRELTKKMNG